MKAKAGMIVVAAGLLAALLAEAGSAQVLNAGTLRRGPDGRLYLDQTYQDASGAGTAGGRTLSVCRSGCDHAALGEAVRASRDGDTITVGAGLYEEAVVITSNHLTIRAETGAHLAGKAAEDKGAIVVKGDDVLIEGLECSGISSSSRNGACVRLEGPNLTLRRVYFHDSEEGVLTGPSSGTVTVEDSRFERLGGGGGYAHGIYAGAIDTLVIRRSQFLSSQDQGHEIKSRARHTIIEDSVVASLAGFDSRLVDVPNGGSLVIRNTVLEKGVNSVNGQVIGFGLEGTRYDENSVLLEKCVVLIDRQASQLVGGQVEASFIATTVIGGKKAAAGTARWFPDRPTANLPPYPFLPAH